MREFAYLTLLQKLLRRQKAPHILLGAGDDAAVLRPSTSQLVLSTDCHIEGVHFSFRYLSPAQAARRALETALSDLAAMGADPWASLAAFQFPPALSEEEALQIGRSLITACRRRNCPLVGGNVAVSKGPVSLTITAVGRLPGRRKPLLRSGARPGQVILATGLPGKSALGLHALKKKAAHRRELKQYVQAYVKPTARLAEGRFLACRKEVGAVIDLSDGLAGDLGHLLAAGDAGAEITVKLPRRFLNACALAGADPLRCLLGSSDDCELLFTAPEACVPAFQKAFRKRFHRPLIVLGTITGQRGLRVRMPGARPFQVKPISFQHVFGKKDR